MIDTRESIDWLISRLRNDQSADGSWDYPFETGLKTDCFMIILLRTLEINDEELIQGLTKRIMSMQEKNGAWKLFHDQKEGDLSTTVEAFYAVLYSGYYPKNDKRLKAARKFIISRGGLEEVSMFTKILLALTGQYKWPTFTPLPVELILLPDIFPINFYSFSVFGRSNLAPIMIIADKKIAIKTVKSPDLTDLHLHRNSGEDGWVRSSEWRSFFSFLEEGVKSLVGLPHVLHEEALQRAKRYMLNHLESDGTFYSYFSSTFLMIYALIALDYKKTDPIITKAIAGLKAMKCEINGLPHMQYTTANVWNTSLASYALQIAGVSPEDEMIMRATNYLLQRQHHKFGDWVIHNPNTMPGGWGFSDINTINPDVDDTTATLRSIARKAPSEQAAWERGVNWALSMQNDDGGWPAFEKNTNNKLFYYLPVEKSEFLLTDPTSADLTGRTLEFYGNYSNLSKNHKAIKKGMKWLLGEQERDGSWYGRWGICYIYGTWAAITGMAAVGTPASHSSVKNAVRWLHSIQNPDGGWGESCYSDIKKKYVELGSSTLTHTSWALDTLISISRKPTKEIERGIDFLIRSIEIDDWTESYPAGQGMAGNFYVHYHSYRYIFPLLALSHYQNKYIQ